jgi:hypothetical protein
VAGKYQQDNCDDDHRNDKALHDDVPNHGLPAAALTISEEFFLLFPCRHHVVFDALFRKEVLTTRRADLCYSIMTTMLQTHLHLAYIVDYKGFQVLHFRRTKGGWDDGRLG